MMYKKNTIHASLCASAASCLFLAAAIESESEENLKKKPKCWIKEYRKTRNRYEITQNLLKDIKPDINIYKNFLKIDEISFNKILSAIKNDIQKQNTIMREAVPVKEKLAITLRFLATGETFVELDKLSKLSTSFLAEAIMETCDAIYNNMKTEFLKFPVDEEEWTKIANEFELKWQFPLCIGALDKKHIGFTPLKKNAPLYYNSLGFHSIVLLAIANANSEFIFIDVGYNGGKSERSMLECSDLMHIIRQADKFLPAKKNIGNKRLLPHVFTTGSFFPLLDNLMTPYPYTTNEQQELFNKRLDQSRQAIRRAFNILTNRFRILKKIIKLKEIKTKKVVLCCCVLHNFFISNNTWYANINLTDENNVSENISSIKHSQNSNAFNKYAKESEAIRRSFTEYFSNEEKL